jgi:uncharacterized protein (DUF305 family)
MNMSHIPRSELRPSVVTIALVLAFATACSKAGGRGDTTAASAPNATAIRTATDTASGTSAMAGAQGMANMTGDADHDFLRMMSDHHKGLIQLVHMTQDRKDVGSAARDAAKLDAVQDKELDRMVTMLEKDFKDPYAPKAMPEHQAMATDLGTRSGREYERTFYQDIVKHHQEAIKMIDDYLPRAKNPTVKRMAEKMKADQTKEIAAFQQKVTAAGPR